MFRVIPFTRYHGGENESGDPEGVRIVWSSDWHQSFQDVELPEDWVRKIYDSRTSRNYGELGRPFPSFDDIKDDMPDVMIFSYWVDHEEKAFSGFCLWLSRVVNEASSVSGDDSYYDYYPDQFHIADQIAQAMTPRWESAVQEAKKEVYNKGLYRDEDMINHGYDVDGGVAGIVGGR